MAGNTANKLVRDPDLKRMKPGEALTYSFPARGEGSMFFRCEPSGTITAFYKFTIEKKQRLMQVGTYKRLSSGTGDSLAVLLEKGRELVAIKKVHGDPKIYLAAAANERLGAQKALELAATEKASSGTFQDLLNYYIRYLRARRAIKANEVERLFRTLITVPHPHLMTTPAHQISEMDIHDIICSVIDKKPAGRGIGNKAVSVKQCSMKSTADSIRRYLKAAFNAGAKAHLGYGDNDNQEKKHFHLVNNPTQFIPSVPDSKGGKTKTLTAEQLGAALRHCDTLGPRHSAIAKGMIYLGGQRVAMLLRMSWDDVRGNLFHMIDYKGKKQKEAFEHIVPVTPRIREILRELLTMRLDPGPFSVGSKPMRPDAISKLFSIMGHHLSKSGETPYFSWQNIRVTCETLMASDLDIDKETRAWLLSHNRTDLQAYHYDRSAYVRQKTDALNAWGNYLDVLHAGRTWNKEPAVLY